MYLFAIVLPQWAVTFRRLHDMGRSGLWTLVAFVPVLGGIAVLIMLLLPSRSFVNRYELRALQNPTDEVLKVLNPQSATAREGFGR